MEVIKGKEIKGYRYADGVHWHWGDEEVAVINDSNEIEWNKRPLNYPKELVDAIRARRNYPAASYLFEVSKVDTSATQGYYKVTVNGQDVIHFGADKNLVDGRYEFSVKDEDLGRFVLALMSKDFGMETSNLKNIIYPKWRGDTV